MIKKLIGTIALSLTCAVSVAAEGGYPLEKAPVRINDMASLQNGAKLFVKVGSPFLAYRQPKVWFIRTFPADPRAIYTDQQSQIELWADARQEKIFELEVTGPDCLIPPGQDISWTETLHLVADPDPMTDDPYRQVRKLETILSAIRP